MTNGAEMPDNACPWCGRERHGQDGTGKAGVKLSVKERWLKCHYCWIMWVEGVFYYWRDKEPSIRTDNWVPVPEGCLIVKREEAI